MINVTVRRNEISPTLRDFAIKFPQEYQKALMDLGARYKNRMRDEIRAGTPAGTRFAPLSAITLDLRRPRASAVRRVIRRQGLAGARRTAAERSGFGGRLPSMTRYFLEPGNRGVHVGFLDNGRSWMRFQTAERRLFNTKERHWLHTRLGPTIPSQKDKPERSGVAPFLPQMIAEASTVITKSMRALLARRGRPLA